MQLHSCSSSCASFSSSCHYDQLLPLLPPPPLTPLTPSMLLMPAPTVSNPALHLLLLPPPYVLLYLCYHLLLMSSYISVTTFSLYPPLSLLPPPPLAASSLYPPLSLLPVVIVLIQSEFIITEFISDCVFLKSCSGE